MELVIKCELFFPITNCCLLCNPNIEAVNQNGALKFWAFLLVKGFSSCTRTVRSWTLYLCSPNEFHPLAEGREICYQRIIHTGSLGLVNPVWTCLFRNYLFKKNKEGWTGNRLWEYFLFLWSIYGEYFVVVIRNTGVYGLLLAWFWFCFLFKQQLRSEE